jgi:hypothetical protein
VDFSDEERGVLVEVTKKLKGRSREVEPAHEAALIPSRAPSSVDNLGVFEIQLLK